MCASAAFPEMRIFCVPVRPLSAWILPWWLEWLVISLTTFFFSILKLTGFCGDGKLKLRCDSHWLASAAQGARPLAEWEARGWVAAVAFVATCMSKQKLSSSMKSAIRSVDKTHQTCLAESGCFDVRCNVVAEVEEPSKLHPVLMDSHYSARSFDFSTTILIHGRHE